MCEGRGRNANAVFTLVTRHNLDTGTMQITRGLGPGDMSTIIVILAATLPMVICDQDARNQLFNDNLGMDTMQGLSGGNNSIIYQGP